MQVSELQDELERSLESEGLATQSVQHTAAVEHVMAQVKKCEQKCLMEVSKAERSKETSERKQIEAEASNIWLKEQNEQLKFAYQEAIITKHAHDFVQQVPEPSKPMAHGSTSSPASTENAGTQPPSVNYSVMGSNEVAYLWYLFNQHSASQSSDQPIGLNVAELFGVLSTLQLCKAEADAVEIFQEMDKKNRKAIAFDVLVAGMDTCCATDQEFAKHLATLARSG